MDFLSESFKEGMNFFTILINLSFFLLFPFFSLFVLFLPFFPGSAEVVVSPALLSFHSLFNFFTNFVMSVKIKSCLDCPLVRKSLIAGFYNDVQLELQIVERGKKGYDLGHPLQKSPVLVVDEQVIFESNAMARFVARSNGDTAKLFGTNPLEEVCGLLGFIIPSFFFISHPIFRLKLRVGSNFRPTKSTTQSPHGSISFSEKSPTTPRL
jgi:Glutathione S-transferase, N-terminal domain